MEDTKIYTPDQALIQPAFDKYLDGQPTRRELQAVFNKIGTKITELFEAVDTQALVGNFLCEKANVTRAEIEVYVQKKAAEIEKLNKELAELKKAAQKKAGEDALSNG